MPENQAQVPYIPLYAIDKHESSCGLSSMYEIWTKNNMLSRVTLLIYLVKKTWNY